MDILTPLAKVLTMDPRTRGQRQGGQFGKSV